MGHYRIRGEEAKVSFAIDGKPGDGSWLLVENFTATPDDEIKVTDFLGEMTSDHDKQHHGWTFRFSCHVKDAKFLDWLADDIARQENAQRPQDIVMTVFYKWRDAADTDRVAVFQDVVIKMDDEGFGGRKEYVNVSFSGRAKRRDLVSA